jgi:hypothetical protein
VCERLVAGGAGAEAGADGEAARLAEPGAAMKLLTISQLTTARSCLRKHDYEYTQGWRAQPSAEASFGTLIHKGLEAWWLTAQDGGDGDERLDAALAAIAVEADPFDRAKASALLKGYTSRWEGEALTVLGVEVEFRAPLVNPETGHVSRTWEVGGKIDAIARDADGRIVIVEHKTSSEDVSPGSDYWRRLTLNGQVSLYYDGAKALDYDIEGCLYDVIAVPGERPKKATPPESRKYKANGELYANQREHDETPDEFEARVALSLTAEDFRRAPVPRLDADLEAARRDVWQWAAILRDTSRQGLAPRSPNACQQYGRLCAYLDVCSGQGSLDSGRFVRLENPHPELAGGFDAAPR